MDTEELTFLYWKENGRHRVQFLEKDYYQLARNLQDLCDDIAKRIERHIEKGSFENRDAVDRSVIEEIYQKAPKAGRISVENLNREDLYQKLSQYV